MNTETQGEIESPEGRAALQRRWIMEAQNRTDALLDEARRLSTSGQGISVERLINQLIEADKLIGIAGRNLPRGYSLVRDGRSKAGAYIRKNGRKVEPEQLGLDIGSGWIEELNAMIDNLLAPKRPKQITGKVGES